MKHISESLHNYIQKDLSIYINYNMEIHDRDDIINIREIDDIILNTQLTVLYTLYRIKNLK